MGNGRLVLAADTGGAPTDNVEAPGAVLRLALVVVGPEAILRRGR